MSEYTQILAALVFVLIVKFLKSLFSRQIRILYEKLKSIVMFSLMLYTSIKLLYNKYYTHNSMFFEREKKNRHYKICQLYRLFFQSSINILVINLLRSMDVLKHPTCSSVQEATPPPPQ